MPVPAYCTNVHAGATLASMLAALDEHATAVRAALVATGDLADSEPLPIGAWFAAQTLRDLDAAGPSGIDSLRRFMEQRRLRVATVNGFPFGDFHAARVKHAVYRPDWADPARARYTIALAELVAALRPEQRLCSISTLPVGWPTPEGVAANDALLRHAALALVQVVEHVVALRDRTGVQVRVDLEPEPGCILQRSGDVATFVERFVRPVAAKRGVDDATLADHLGVCLDVCHAAVMFEPVEEFVATVHGAGLRIGKMQLSSAPCVDFEKTPTTRRDGAAALAALSSFAEDRYLHQTMVRLPDGTFRFSEDLPDALAWVATDRPARGEWRVHFHVPLFLSSLGNDSVDTIGALSTTQGLIVPALLAAAVDDPTIEVETYAWSVLPSSMRPAGDGIGGGDGRGRRLADGIAEELRWTVRTTASALPEAAE